MKGVSCSESLQLPARPGKGPRRLLMVPTACSFVGRESKVNYFIEAGRDVHRDQAVHSLKILATHSGNVDRHRCLIERGGRLTSLPTGFKP